MPSDSKYAGTCTDSATIGTVAWSNPTRAEGTSDTSVADVLYTNVGDVTHYLLCTDYVIVPDPPGPGTTVAGIKVTVRKVGQGSIDHSVRLLKAGVPVGDDKATATHWPDMGLDDTVYGGDGDLWGEAWSIEEIEASGFGVAIAAECWDTGGFPIGMIDSVLLEVFFEAEEDGPELINMRCGNMSISQP